MRKAQEKQEQGPDLNIKGKPWRRRASQSCAPTCAHPPGGIGVYNNDLPANEPLDAVLISDEEAYDSPVLGECLQFSIGMRTV